MVLGEKVMWHDGCNGYGKREAFIGYIDDPLYAFWDV